MATTWKIETKSTSVSLQINASNCYVREGSWRRTPAGEGRVLETFDLVFTGTDNTMMVNIEKLARLQSYNDLFYNDPTNNESVWWVLYAGSETAKRALIHSIGFVASIEGVANPTLGYAVAVYTVAVERSEDYERTTHLAGPTVNGLSTYGGLHAINATTYPMGDLGGYISKLTISAPSTVTTALYRIWMGIRRFTPDTYSDINSSFDATLEAEAGTAAAGSFVNDATANPAGTSSNCLEVTTVPASLTEAWSLYLYQANATYYNLYTGDWLILGRIKVNAGTVGVQLRWGRKAAAAASENLQNNEMVYVSNTDWRLIELGSVRWPSIGAQIWTLDLYNEILRLYIQQIAGTTTSFKLDGIIVIPARHMVKLVKTNIIYTNTGKQYLYKREDGKDSALAEISAKASHVPDPTFVNWYLPPDSGFLVFAAERETAHNLADTVNLAIDTYSMFVRDIGT